MASICYEGTAIPLLWTVLDKDGSSSAEEQIALVKRIKDLLGVERIEGLLADREFGNKEFIRYLHQEDIPFYIRIKEDNLVYVNGKKFKKAGELFPHLKRYSPRIFGMHAEIFEGTFYLTASKNERDELMIVITNKDYQHAINIYLRRWEVECLFQALKGRGFNFEDTRITQPLRIEKMIAVLALAFVVAHKTGEWQDSIRPIRLKKLKTFLKVEKRPEFSFFRYGLDAITGLTIQWKILKIAFKFLEKPPAGAIL